MELPATEEAAPPVTLHGVIQALIGEALRSHYQAPQNLSHELFVLMLQLNEQERKPSGRTAAPKPRRRSSRAAQPAMAMR